MKQMKMMSKLLCSVLVLCGAFSMSAIAVNAADNPTETNETIISSEVIETVAVPLIPEITDVPETTDNNQTTEDVTNEAENTENEETTESEAPKIPGGNGTVIEDVHSDVADRQFITVQSKGGNTFYIVIDKDSKGKENVYFMNLVDEYDLLAFAEDFPENAPVKVPDTQNKSDPESSEENQSAESTEGEKTEQSSKGNNSVLLIIIGVLALGGGGAFYYFKVYKNKPKAPKQSDLSDEDEEEYEEETVNEDTDESDNDDE